MNRVTKLLLNRIKYWAKKTNVTEFWIDTSFDSDKYIAAAGKIYVNNDWVSALLIRQNNKFFSTLEIDSTILHELGHIKYKHNMHNAISTTTRVKFEYLAEKFCYETLKKYAPKKALAHKKEWLKSIEGKSWKKKYPVHYAAFKKLYLSKEVR